MTEEQKAVIIGRSREAQVFIRSNLYKEITEWAAQEQAMTAGNIAANARGDNEVNMTRSEFVEQRIGYYRALPTILGVFKSWAGQEEQIAKQEEKKDEATG